MPCMPTSAELGPSGMGFGLTSGWQQNSQAHTPADLWWRLATAHSVPGQTRAAPPLTNGQGTNP